MTSGEIQIILNYTNVIQIDLLHTGKYQQVFFFHASGSQSSLATYVHETSQGADLDLLAVAIKVWFCWDFFWGGGGGERLLTTV